MKQHGDGWHDATIEIKRYHLRGREAGRKYKAK
jgi:hypothetical protein